MSRQRAKEVKVDPLAVADKLRIMVAKETLARQRVEMFGAQEDHKAMSKLDRQRNGFVGNHTMRHIGSIPVGVFREFCRTHDRHDTKALKAFLRSSGYNTVPANSF